MRHKLVKGKHVISSTISYFKDTESHIICYKNNTAINLWVMLLLRIWKL